MGRSDLNYPDNRPAVYHQPPAPAPENGRRSENNEGHKGRHHKGGSVFDDYNRHRHHNHHHGKNHGRYGHHNHHRHEMEERRELAQYQQGRSFFSGLLGGLIGGIPGLIAGLFIAKDKNNMESQFYAQNNYNNDRENNYT